MADPVAAILLAAGQSSRLGQPKQLVAVDGEPLLCRTVRLALAAGCRPVMVVLGAAEPDCRAALVPLVTEHPGDLRVVSNARWREGMSTSLRAGLSALADFQPEAVLVLVADQARLTAGSLRLLLDAHAAAGTPITAARYSGQMGVPAIFHSELFQELAGLTGDQGARRLMDPARTTAVDLPEAAFDLDTPEDLAEIERSRSFVS